MTIKMPKLKKAKGDAWKLFSIYIRLRDAIETTESMEDVVCCTCGRTYPAFGAGCAQAGHYTPGRKNAILFDERGCHAQCFNCNFRLKGNPIKYRRFMIAKHGEEITTEIESNSFKTVKISVPDLMDLQEEIKVKTNILRNTFREMNY